MMDGFERAIPAPEGFTYTKRDPPPYSAPKPLRILSYDDMIQLPDPEWLIEGLLMERSSALLFGKSNSFKSFLAIDIACSIAAAETVGTWQGVPFRQCKWSDDGLPRGGRVLYIATEGALGVAKQRIPGWMNAHDIDPKTRRNVELYPQEIALDDDRAIDDLLATLALGCWERDSALPAGERAWDAICPDGVKEAGLLKRPLDDDDVRMMIDDYALIVVDVFGSSMGGSEVSDETARAWVRNVNRIQRVVGCATLTVAHSGWGDSERLRGHSHFWGSFDTRMKAEGDKDSRTTVLKIDRHKDADSAGEWGFKLETTPTGLGKTTLYPVLSDGVKVEQKRRVSGKPLVALQALDDALRASGRKINSPDLPSCPVVDYRRWQEMCDRHALSDGEAEAKKKAFQRAKNALLSKGVIRCFDEFVWRAEA